MEEIQRIFKKICDQTKIPAMNGKKSYSIAGFDGKWRKSAGNPTGKQKKTGKEPA